MVASWMTTWIDKLSPHIDVVLGTAFIIAAALTAILYINKILFRLLFDVRSRFRLSYETILIITRLVGFVMWIGTCLLLLSFWGISVSGLWTVLMSVAAVIGVGFLAVWTMVSNMTANIFITIWRPFHMGATVEMLPENLCGRVIDRNMMFTVLREKSGATLCIPNNLFFQKVFRVTENDHQHLFEFLERNDVSLKTEAR
jgi:small-conductance mechanosensitive channel